MDGSGTIDLNELITEFSDLNTESVILDLVKIINAGKADSSFVFSRFAVKDKKKQRLYLNEFVKLLRELQP